jgi:hypothetical protein
VNSYVITIAVSPHDCTNMLSTNTSNHNVPENCIEASINKFLRMDSDLNTWTSTFVVTHGDKSIDVSLAAKGHISSFPSLISPTQRIEYSLTKYCFDENLFFGIDAKESLCKMLKSPNCIDGCKMVANRVNNTSSSSRKCAWTFVCSHGVVMNEIDQSQFCPDSVGNPNVPVQYLRRVRFRGSAVKGKFLVM